MANVTITQSLIEEIATISKPHLKALNEAVTERWPDEPDMYLTLAIGWYVSALFGNHSVPWSAVDAINALVGVTGFAFTPVTPEP